MKQRLGIGLIYEGECSTVTELYSALAKDAEVSQIVRRLISQVGLFIKNGTLEKIDPDAAQTIELTYSHPILYGSFVIHCLPKNARKEKMVYIEVRP